MLAISLYPSFFCTYSEIRGREKNSFDYYSNHTFRLSWFSFLFFLWKKNPSETVWCWFKGWQSQKVPETLFTKAMKKKHARIHTFKKTYIYIIKSKTIENRTVGRTFEMDEMEVNQNSFSFFFSKLNYTQKGFSIDVFFIWLCVCVYVLYPFDL